MRYEAPESLEGAVALLAGATGEARVLAGGTDLLVQMRADVVDPDLIVDIKRIAALRQGALEVRECDVARDEMRDERVRIRRAVRFHSRYDLSREADVADSADSHGRSSFDRGRWDAIRPTRHMKRL